MTKIRLQKEYIVALEKKSIPFKMDYVAALDLELYLETTPAPKLLFLSFPFLICFDKDIESYVRVATTESYVLSP